MRIHLSLAALLLSALTFTPIVNAAETRFPTASEIEVLPTDAKQTKIVLIAGTNTFKPGEHEYVVRGNLAARSANP